LLDGIVYARLFLFLIHVFWNSIRYRINVFRPSPLFLNLWLTMHSIFHVQSYSTDFNYIYEMPLFLIQYRSFIHLFLWAPWPSFGPIKTNASPHSAPEIFKTKSFIVLCNDILPVSHPPNIFLVSRSENLLCEAVLLQDNCL